MKWRPDARVNEARAMLSMRRTLDGLSPGALISQFNLRQETARKLLEYEQIRRQRNPWKEAEDQIAEWGER